MNIKDLDLAGLGKIAEAIPPEVYIKDNAALVATFQKLTAPITETTAGLGRYLRQKFDNMVEAEKAVANFTIQKAIARAQARAERLRVAVHPPAHVKSFVKAIEESSKETDPLLHEMWANLLASQLADDHSHPHFVETLSHFSPAEAKLLISLRPLSEVKLHFGAYASQGPYPFTHWVHDTSEELHSWALACELLCGFRFADLLAPLGDSDNTAILYRTATGAAFLSAVSPTQGECQGIPALRDTDASRISP